jgi:hypothetical protein
MLTAKEFPTYGVAKKNAPDRQPAPIPQMVALLLLPTLVFAATFWLTSFSLRYSSGSAANLLSYCMVLPGLAFFGLSLGASGKERVLSIIISGCCLLAWAAASIWGDYNYQSLMRPHYDITQLNTYQQVDPINVTGSQFMDAGMIQFVDGTRYLTKYSMSFKNGDTYCVAPIGTGQANASTYDFWAVGINCCTGHGVVFTCGDFSATSAWGVRVMEDSHRSMYEVAIKQAEATFSIKGHQPILMYMMADPHLEVQQWSDDGIKNFTFALFAWFALQIAITVAVAAALPWL